MNARTLSFLTRPFFPTRCFQCNGLLGPIEQSLCQFCLASLPRLSTLDREKLVRIGTTIHSHFQASLFFTEPVQTLCYSLKYGNNPTLARTLGERIIAPDLITHWRKNGLQTRNIVLCPMPIHSRRKLKRGYNQSTELALGCARGLRNYGLQAQVLPVLQKSGHRKSQINFGPFERWSNTSAAFRVNVAQKKRIPKDALVIVVDDTVTTGSSMLHAGEALKKELGTVPVLLHALALEI